MDKFSKSPLSMIGSVCLIAFLLPGVMVPWPNGAGQHIVLGLIQPGWCRIEIDPPQLSGVIPGVHFDISFSWLFLFVFVVCNVIGMRKPSIEEDYSRTMRRARY